MRVPMVVLFIAMAFEVMAAAAAAAVHDFVQPIGLFFFFLYIVMENGGPRKLR